MPLHCALLARALERHTAGCVCSNVLTVNLLTAIRSSVCYLPSISRLPVTARAACLCTASHPAVTSAHPLSACYSLSFTTPSQRSTIAYTAGSALLSLSSTLLSIAGARNTPASRTAAPENPRLDHGRRHPCLLPYRRFELRFNPPGLRCAHATFANNHFTFIVVEIELSKSNCRLRRRNKNQSRAIDPALEQSNIPSFCCSQR